MHRVTTTTRHELHADFLATCAPVCNGGRAIVTMNGAVVGSVM